MYGVSNKLTGLILLVFLTACSSSSGGGGSNGGNTNNGDNTNKGDTGTPAITVSDSVSPNDDFQMPFGSVTLSGTLDKSVTITNDGTADLVLGTIANTNALAEPFSISADNCSGQTLAPAASCTVTIQFAPTSADSFTDSFDIPSNDTGSASVTMSISGTGAAGPVPHIAVTDTVTPNDDQLVTFGSVTLNATRVETVTVTNEGSGDLVVDTVGNTDALAAPFSLSNDACSGQTLSTNTSCTITVQFLPTATGTFNGKFDIPSNDPDQPSITVNVRGFGGGASAPNIAVTDTVAPIADRQVPFGNITINSSLDNTVTITNNGTADLVLGTLASSDTLATPFSITTDNCSGQTLSPATSCNITIHFAPTSAATFNDSFDIPSNDPDEPSVTIGVSGTGDSVAVPDITVSDAVFPTSDLRIPFGSVTANHTVDEKVTISNSGTAALTLGSIGSINPLAAPFSIINDNCSGQTLAPAASCDVTVHFAPTTTGAFNDSFDIPSDDPDEPSVTMSVSSTGNATSVPDILITDGVDPSTDRQMVFTTTTVGSTTTTIFAIFNRGTANLSIGAIGGANGLDAPFNLPSDAVSDQCSGQTLPPTGICTVTLQFAPTTAGTFNDSFDIPSNDPDESSATFNVTGTSTP